MGGRRETEYRGGSEDAIGKWVCFILLREGDGSC